jgi:hypothetical protein
VNVTRNVILDLVPVYLAGEASADTRQLMDEYMKQDAELAREVREKVMSNLASVAPPMLPPELELKALARTRRVLSLQRWLFGLAIFFSLIPFSTTLQFSNGKLVDAWLVARDYPELAMASLMTALGLWTGFYFSRRRQRTII